jgi:hypothetical protein
MTSKIKFLILFVLIGSGLNCQTVSEISMDKNETQKFYKKNDPNDSLASKPTYRRGVHYLVTTKDGLVYKGFVIKETENEIQLEDRRTGERFNIKRIEIKTCEPLSHHQQLINLIGENRHARQYLLASSAFLFDPEHISSSFHWFLLEDVDYAITENWAVGAYSFGPYPFSLNAKCAFQLDENTFIGGGAFALADISGNIGSFLGYGGIVKLTSGTSNRNITISGGLLSINSDVFFTSGTVPTAQYLNVYFANLAYCKRLNEYLALNLEGWYFPDSQFGIAGGGIKLVKNEFSCWTFGCYSFLNMQTTGVTLNLRVLPVPYIGLAQKF